MRFLALCLAFAVAGASASAAKPPDQGPEPLSRGDRGSRLAREARQLEHEAHRLEVQLRARGYEVERGSFKLFTVDDCRFPITVLGNCLGNNPAAPYVIPVVPPWPDEYVETSLDGLLGPTAGGASGAFRFDQRDALLVFGLLPPPARYFGFQTYVFTRQGAIDPADPIFQATQSDPKLHDVLFARAPDPSRVLAFSSLGNSINHVVIERQSGAAFDRERAFVISTDAALAREMTEALVHARIAGREGVFTEPVSSAVARLGLDRAADAFMTIIRYTRPEDPGAGDHWRRQIPLAVLRVRDRHATASEAWPRPDYEDKTAHSELGLESDLGTLVAAVKQQWGQPQAVAGAFRSLQNSVDLIGQHCLGRPMNCVGDTQDADYQVSPTIDLDAGQVVAVAGTLGTATGNASYVGLSVNWLEVLQGVANLSDTDLAGSASPWSPLLANSGKLYLQYFARDCTGLAHCLEVTQDMVPAGNVIKIIQRNYVVPGTARGPDPRQLLNPVAIVLDGRTRP